MIRAFLAVVFCAALTPVLAVNPTNLTEAVTVLTARLLELTPPATKLEAAELKSLTLAQINLLAYGGGADKTGLRQLATVVKGLEKANSPALDVVAVLGLVRDHLTAMAQDARADAELRLILIEQDSSRLKLVSALDKAAAALASAAPLWSVSPSKGAKSQCKGIATYQKIGVSIDKVITSEAGAHGETLTAIRHPGPTGAPGGVTFLHAGQPLTVTAYPGEVQVHFTTPLSVATARALLKMLGGTVLAQIPTMGYYVVQVLPGMESGFINDARTLSTVALAFPHLAGLYAGTGVTVIDDCDGSHGTAVQKVLSDRGIAIDACRVDGTRRPIPSWTIDEAEKAIMAAKTGPVLINISSYQGLVGGAKWENQPETVRNQVVVTHTYDRKSLLKAIAQLPLAYRENLVITLCAGNSHMPLDGMLAELAADPSLLAILRNNVIIVGSKGQDFSNYASVLLDDFAWVNNPEAADGTSFAAPYALALIRKIMDARGVSATAALQIVKAAVADNPQHELVEAEVLPDHPANRYVGAIAGQTTDTVDGSVWKAEVSLGLTVTLSGSGVIGDPYLVRLDFSGNLTETLIHCGDAGGCDPGGTYPVTGTGEGSSLNKIIVTALMDGTPDYLSVKLTDGTLNSDRTKLTGTVRVESPAFDSVVSAPVTFNFTP